MKPKYTPMMMQYLEIKDQYKDTIILYRLGDFYEMFFDDAIEASKILDIALTSRGSTGDNKIPMCGVPFHSVSGYIQKLLDANKKVGIVEQLEDPKSVKGIVKRGVVKILSAGTDVEIALQANHNNYIASLSAFDTHYCIAFCDLSTGEFLVNTIIKNKNTLESELLSMNIKEVVVNKEFDTSILSNLVEHYGIMISVSNDENFNRSYERLFVNIGDIKQIKTSSLLLNYLLTMQKTGLEHLKPIKEINHDSYLNIDVFSKNNLELTETIRGKSRHGSLLWLLDKTHTAMGARMLRQWIEKPLVNQIEIENRLDIIESMNRNFIVRDSLKELLKEVYDIERLVARIICGNVNAKDLIWMAKSIEILPELVSQCREFDHQEINEMIANLPDLKSLSKVLLDAFVENPPHTIRDGGMFNIGYNEELDQYLLSKRDGKQWLVEYENSEKERTGIKNLKVGFNKVFGYYIEITKSYLPLVKEEFGYERRQSIAGGERYITPRLKELETVLLHASDKACELEYQLFNQLKDMIKERISDIQIVATTIAKIDVYQSLAITSNQSGYVRPVFNTQNLCEIKEGRHPVIEKVMNRGQYVENDCILNQGEYVLLITGPNMGGKSTYMRQIALIVIMAQIGCFVPASYANLPIFDAIFTRIGASDDLISGQSTFMVEMMEANMALRNASKNSLIIFDEIGRGTATFDGMAIAQSIVEHIAKNIQCTTLFSTHYHELTMLEDEIPGIKNVHAGVSEKENEIVFLYKMLDGKSNKSYGINVARLARLPESILHRANIVLHELETNNIHSHPQTVKPTIIEKESEVEQQLLRINPMNMSPMDALSTLIELKKMIKEES